jgi:hypothetical protein
MDPDYGKWVQDPQAAELHGTMAHVGERIFSGANVSVKTGSLRFIELFAYYHCNWGRSQKTAVIALCEGTIEAENNIF